MQRFLDQNAAVAGCWNWPNWKDKDGYGRTKFNGKTAIAHRVAYILACGPIPDGLVVCHRCDNPACCRPDHLFVGTQADNCRDAMLKDRHCRGMRNGLARLTDDDVRFIRAQAGRVTQVSLAAKFNVRQSSIWLIQNRKQWAHVQD